MDLTESYKSLSEALIHAGVHTQTKVISTILTQRRLKKMELKALSNMSAVLVPGGFGLEALKVRLKQFNLHVRIIFHF